jgi:hypothetical protein
MPRAVFSFRVSWGAEGRIEEEGDEGGEKSAFGHRRCAEVEGERGDDVLRYERKTIKMS